MPYRFGRAINRHIGGQAEAPGPRSEFRIEVRPPALDAILNNAPCPNEAGCGDVRRLAA
jgi:hypothetical protein